MPMSDRSVSSRTDHPLARRRTPEREEDPPAAIKGVSLPVRKSRADHPLARRRTPEREEDPPAAIEGVSLPVRKKSRRAYASPARSAYKPSIVSPDATSNSTAGDDSSRRSGRIDGKEDPIKKNTPDNGADADGKKGRSKGSRRSEAFKELVETYPKICTTEHPYLHAALDTVGGRFGLQAVMAEFRQLRKYAANPASRGTSDAADDVESGGGDTFDPYQLDIYKEFSNGKEYHGRVIPRSRALLGKGNKIVPVWRVKYDDNDQEQMEKYELLLYGRRKKDSQRLKAYIGRD
jgi:hypothetical protein